MGGRRVRGDIMVWLMSRHGNVSLLLNANNQLNLKSFSVISGDRGTPGSDTSTSFPRPFYFSDINEIQGALMVLSSLRHFQGLFQVQCKPF